MDEKFVDEVSRRYGAVPAAAREEAELMELLLPGLRADISVCDTYIHVEDDLLDCPIGAYGGEKDHEVSREELAAWQQQTREPFTLIMFPGDHFFLQTAQLALLQTVSDELRRMAP